MDIFEYNIEDIKKDLFLYYKCDSDNNQTDYSGNSNIGTLNNSPDFDGIDGKVKGCFDFNGNTGKIQSALNFDTSSYDSDLWTFSSWIKPLTSSGSSYRCLFRGGVSGMGLYIRNDRYEGFDNVNVNFTNTTPSLGEWQHVVSTYNNPTWKIYINGELKQTLTKTKSRHISFLKFGSDDSNHGDQKMDEIYFWGRELNSDEIKRLYLYYKRINKKFN